MPESNHLWRVRAKFQTTFVLLLTNGTFFNTDSVIVYVYGIVYTLYIMHTIFYNEIFLGGYAYVLLWKKFNTDDDAETENAF